MLGKIKNRQPQAGFTLVELLIVIVVIAILAAIAITAFSGVQAQARDTQRQSDIDQVASQLELYYTEEGNYPLPGDMTGTSSAVTGLFGGLSPDALHEPQDTSGDQSNSFTNAVPTAAGTYGYQAYTDASNGTVCTAADDCQSFVLSYWKETKDGGADAVTVEDVSGD